MAGSKLLFINSIWWTDPIERKEERKEVQREGGWKKRLVFSIRNWEQRNNTEKQRIPPSSIPMGVGIHFWSRCCRAMLPLKTLGNFQCAWFLPLTSNRHRPHTLVGGKCVMSHLSPSYLPFPFTTKLLMFTNLSLLHTLLKVVSRSWQGIMNPTSTASLCSLPLISL